MPHLPRRRPCPARSGRRSAGDAAHDVRHATGFPCH
ncbi:CbtB domain-containing protein [Leisingera sp. ANG-S]